MICTVLDLSFSYLCSAVEASLDIKKVRMEPNYRVVKSFLKDLKNYQPIHIESTAKMLKLKK